MCKYLHHYHHHHHHHHHLHHLHHHHRHLHHHLHHHHHHHLHHHLHHHHHHYYYYHHYYKCTTATLLLNTQGTEGFRNVKKRTSVAAQATGLTVGNVGGATHPLIRKQCVAVHVRLTCKR